MRSMVSEGRHCSILLSLVLLSLTACGDAELPASHFSVLPSDVKPLTERKPCNDFDPLKNAYFGDLHVHTSLSNDAYSFGLRQGPSEAYRYAFGQGDIRLPVDKNNDANIRLASIDRPLDFMAVTDHAEFLGEQTLCMQWSEQQADQERPAFCSAFEEGEGRNPGLLAKIFSPFPTRDKALCGDDGAICATAALQPWRQIIQAAEQWNDTSVDCERSAFIGFEYSSVRLGSNLHRNVIFRNSIVPQRPISYLDAPREWRLWELLDQECLSSDTGCDALAIPHNSNISNGRMFATDYAGAWTKTEQAKRATLRSKIEPMVEIMQHKGDSECRNNLSNVLGGEDELCNFEKFENLAFETIVGSLDIDDCYSGPLADYVPHKGPNCLTRNSYVRYALIEGLREQQRIGVNPFKFGLMASTDTHNGMGGGVAEQDYQGHLGWGDGKTERRLRYDNSVPGNASNNPGGLIGVWAQQNTRDSLFDSMRQKEVFGTSGPRIKPRFFGGWHYDSAICGDPNLLTKAYSAGVPMGGDLPPKTAEAPVFIASAVADVGTAAAPGLPLQRLQIIKGWYDDKDKHHQKVIDIAGEVSDRTDSDLGQCQSTMQGARQLCGVWQDPDFDPLQSAVYYLRVVEVPSCRYTARQCLALSPAERPADCDNPKVPKVIQERAWSSPIWYTAEAN